VVQLRRSAKENNFKAVLETIRDVMNVATVGKAIPPWLHDVFLGYGDPAAATYRSLPPPYSQLRDIDFCDTFINGQHALSCFPDADVTLVDESGSPLSDPASVQPPFRVKFESDSGREKVTIVSYPPPTAGPYPEDVPRKNPVPFTPVQTEAIRSGCNPGLTLIVGPPGTGKTDVAVQIISNLYHNFPEQRTLLVTHSNHVRAQCLRRLVL
jgi:intron-binding protein aquarius